MHVVILRMEGRVCASLLWGVCECVFAEPGCDKGVRGPDRVYILVNEDRCVNDTPVAQ